MKKNNMEKEFVPYAESLELKQLGFDELCLGYWDTDPYFGKPIFYMVIPFDHECCLPAPLYQQAFRWFRKKYGYEIYIISGTIFRASYVIGIPKEINMESVDGYPLVTSWDYIVDETDERKTYEEAELACLKQLIEIVKNK